MKNRIFWITAMCFICLLCACSKETTKTVSDTVDNKEQVTSSESKDEKNSEDKTEQKEDEEEKQSQTKQSSYTEFQSMLDEINTDIHPGTAGEGLSSIRVASHLLNWGVETDMSTDEVKKETAAWLLDKGNSEQIDFSNKMASVYNAYKSLLGPDANNLLTQAGCEDVPFSWGNTPIDTIEAIVEVVQLPEGSTTDGAVSDTDSTTENKNTWPDVAELVNQKGDETTVYLLADGRYMDRINAVYTYDGKDTWTDEAGVEWNRAVK